MTHIQRIPRALAAVGSLAVILAAGCNSDKLLRTSDPDLIAPGNINSAAAAQALRIGAINRLARATGLLAENTWLYGGLMADEYSSSSTFDVNDQADKRDVLNNNTAILDAYREINRVRTAANQAKDALERFDPDATEEIAEMYLLRGYAEMQIAESFCNGTPLSDASVEPPVPGEEMTNAEVLEAAIASFDEALAAAEADGLIARAAQVGKGRALRQLARYSEAAAAVTGVPKDFKYQLTFASTTGDNVHWGQINSAGRFSIGDSVEGNSRNILVRNAIPFYSAQDPRVLAKYTTQAKTSGTGLDTLKGQDGSTFLRTLVNVYPLRTTPIQIMNGIDAQLIRAEAALAAGSGTWLTILNDMRADRSLYPPGTPTSAATLGPLSDPGTPEARVSLLFREKAFWTFGRGQRLGDLRHLARDYDRPVDQVFPVGVYYKGGDYADDANFPVPQAEENNPLFNDCLDRNP